MAAEVSEEELAWLLMATAARRSCPDVNIYYWPTHEGQGRQYYVYEVSMDPGFSDPIQASLRRVSVERRDGVVELTEMWPSPHGSLPQRYVPLAGPVTTLELDFDEDGVIDVFAFSEDDEGNYDTTFAVVSGRTGEELGRIKGDEVVITRSARGVVIRTQGRFEERVKVGDSTYLVRSRIHRRYVVKEGKLVLAAQQREPAYYDIDGPIGRRPAPDERLPEDIGRPRAPARQLLLRPERKWEDLASLAPGEQLLAHVGWGLNLEFIAINEHGGVPILTPWNKKALEEANVRVLVDYRPPKREEPPQL